MPVSDLGWLMLPITAFLSCTTHDMPEFSLVNILVSKQINAQKPTFGTTVQIMGSRYIQFRAVVSPVSPHKFDEEPYLRRIVRSIDIHHGKSLLCGCCIF